MVDINVLKNFQQDNWNALSETEKKHTLQSIINVYLPVSEYKVNYKIEFVDFESLNKMGEFDPNTNTIKISKNLATNNEMEVAKNVFEKVKYSANQVYFLLMHEIKHAMQSFELGEISPRKDNAKLRSLRNNQQIYFKICRKSPNSTKNSRYLYMLQPLEKEAYEFANKEMEYFSKQMKELFPSDKAFSENITYSFFDKTLNTSNEELFSNNAVKDIENIINTIAGEFVVEPLNPFICHVVEQTQEPTFHKMLVQQAKINNELIEKEQENFRNKEKTIVIDESLWESIDIEK